MKRNLCNLWMMLYMLRNSVEIGPAVSAYQLDHLCVSQAAGQLLGQLSINLNSSSSLDGCERVQSGGNKGQPVSRFLVGARVLLREDRIRLISEATALSLLLNLTF